MQRPLSEELRPFSLEECVGIQNPLFSTLLKHKKPLSILLFGPPGCGKTTLARIYLRAFKANSLSFHPAIHSLADIKKWVEEIKSSPFFYPINLLFIDEIHRMNKAQQDALLPFLEDGTFALIGATTENPSFALNNALLSRLRILPLQALPNSALEQILETALQKKGLSSLSSEEKLYLIDAAKGDARHLLNCVETLLIHPTETKLDVTSLSFKKNPLYDKTGDGHFGLISALHKSIRASDSDAALYWLARMLQGGEDPCYIGRRLVRIAIEDIGLAEPQAQTIALHAWESYERLGSPEGDLSLAEAVLFLALAPKSTAAYKAFQSAQRLAEETSHLPPPSFLLHHSPVKLPIENSSSRFPAGINTPSFYEPLAIGFERELKKRKEFFAAREQ